MPGVSSRSCGSWGCVARRLVALFLDGFVATKFPRSELAAHVQADATAADPQRHPGVGAEAPADTAIGDVPALRERYRLPLDADLAEVGVAVVEAEAVRARRIG